MEYEPPRDWWGVWENAAAVAFKNGRLRIEAPVRLSHAESWREGAVIHCKGYRLHPREPDAECTRAGGSTGTQQEKGRVGPLELCRTISGNVRGKKGNAPETHGTRNGTHGNVGKVDMCVLNPAPRNPGWKWGRGGCFSFTFDFLSKRSRTTRLRNTSISCVSFGKSSLAPPCTGNRRMASFENVLSPTTSQIP
uniref:Uncharacterized protein n=1 Tax=Brassica campestris TaxID=3711 RepID=M4DFA5_BRACM